MKKHPHSPQRRSVIRVSRSRARFESGRRAQRRSALQALSLAIFASGALLLGRSAQAANTPDYYTGSATGSILTPTNWSTGAVPTITNDAVFGIGAATGIRTFNSGTVTFGSLNSLNANTITIRDEAATNSTLILGGSGNLGNSTLGANFDDLLYVVSGGTLNLTANNGSGGNLNVVLGQNGNFNLKGTAASTITSAISGAFTLTKLGTGTLTLSGANTFGALAIGGGTVNIGNGTTGSLASGTGVTFNAGGGILNINEGANSAQNLGTVNFASGEGNIVSTFTSGTANLTLTNGFRSTGATRVFTLSGGALYKAGFMMAQGGLDPDLRLPLLTIDETDPAAGRRNLSDWLRENRPQAILSDMAETPGMLEKIGCRVPDDVGLATLSILDGNASAGIDQHPEEVGRVAVLLILSLMNDSVQGVPTIFRQILIEGSWVDGPSLPVRRAEPQHT